MNAPNICLTSKFIKKQSTKNLIILIYQLQFNDHSFTHQVSRKPKSLYENETSENPFSNKNKKSHQAPQGKVVFRPDDYLQRDPLCKMIRNHIKAHKFMTQPQQT